MVMCGGRIGNYFHPLGFFCADKIVFETKRGRQASGLEK
jgi:hypothetical protein